MEKVRRKRLQKTEILSLVLLGKDLIIYKENYIGGFSLVWPRKKNLICHDVSDSPDLFIRQATRMCEILNACSMGTLQKLDKMVLRSYSVPFENSYYWQCHIEKNIKRILRDFDLTDACSIIFSLIASSSVCEVRRYTSQEIRTLLETRAKRTTMVKEGTRLTDIRDGCCEAVYVRGAKCWAVEFRYNIGDPNNVDFEERNIPCSIFVNPRTGKSRLDGEEFRWNTDMIRKDNLTKRQANEMAMAL